MLEMGVKSFQLTRPQISVHRNHKSEARDFTTFLPNCRCLWTATFAFSAID